MPLIASIADLRAAIRVADLPKQIRDIALRYLDAEPDRELDGNAARAFFWFGPIQLRPYAAAILDAAGQSEPRSRVVRLRLTESEHAELVQAAEDAGLTLSAHMRAQLGLDSIP